jgi:hypothetical protein
MDMSDEDHKLRDAVMGTDDQQPPRDGDATVDGDKANVPAEVDTGTQPATSGGDQDTTTTIPDASPEGAADDDELAKLQAEMTGAADGEKPDPAQDDHAKDVPKPDEQKPADEEPETKSTETEDEKPDPKEAKLPPEVKAILAKNRQEAKQARTEAKTYRGHLDAQAQALRSAGLNPEKATPLLVQIGKAINGDPHAVKWLGSLANEVGAVQQPTAPAMTPEIQAFITEAESYGLDVAPIKAQFQSQANVRPAAQPATTQATRPATAPAGESPAQQVDAFEQRVSSAVQRIQRIGQEITAAHPTEAPQVVKEVQGEWERVVSKHVRDEGGEPTPEEQVAYMKQARDTVLARRSKPAPKPVPSVSRGSSPSGRTGTNADELDAIRREMTGR